MKVKILACISILCIFSCSTSHKHSNVIDYTDMVEPLVDAANSRWFYFNSTSRPFGMMNLSPDMITNGAWNAGYRYNEDSIKAFSHVHAWQLSAVPVFAQTGTFKGHLGSRQYGSTYSHEDETVEVGYHQVKLNSYQINAELTATKRVGLHKYTFPKSDSSFILFDFSTVLGPCATDSAHIELVNHKTIQGWALMGKTKRRPKATKVFYYALFDTEFDAAIFWKNKQKINQNIQFLTSDSTGVGLHFKTDQGQQIMMKVAISYTSIENAKLNMQSELNHFDFQRVVDESKDEWNTYLSRIQVQGNTQKAQKRFYTDLWHALQGRRVVSDYNGSYMDMTQNLPVVRTVALDKNGEPEHLMYNSDSFWGAQWTLNTLWHLVYPEITSEFIRSMLTMYENGGLIPRGPSGGNYTYVMTGASSTPFIVSAYQKGIRDFDVQKAYQGLLKNHSVEGLMSKAGYDHYSNLGGGFSHYDQKGYVPYPLPEKQAKVFHQDGGGQTLEYAYQDWCLAQFSKALNDRVNYKKLMHRSQSYKNLWHPKKQYMWLKNNKGAWVDSMDIFLYKNGWVEGNAAQFTWWVPHDIKGLADLMGGSEKCIERLDSIFKVAQQHSFVAGKSHDAGEQEQNTRVHMNYGNQPSIHMAHIFHELSRPDLTHYWSERVVEKVYSDLEPNAGYCGDEDQGLMGSLSVLLKLGIFQMNGGCESNPAYSITPSIFDRVKIQLSEKYYQGKEIVLENNKPNENKAFWGVFCQQQQFKQARIDHQTFTKGGTFKMQYR